MIKKAIKLSEMTQEQKSRWIAEKIEPKPASEPGLHDSQYSVYAAWIYEKIDVYTGEWGWQPRDMTEPAMTVMLMERGPICVTRCKRAGKPRGWTAFKPDFSLDGPGSRDEWPVVGSIGQAVADAFMKANGFKEEK